MLPPKVSPVDRPGLRIGGRVQVLANAARLPERTAGTIVGFSSGSEHPSFTRWCRSWESSSGRRQRPRHTPDWWRRWRDSSR